MAKQLGWLEASWILQYDKHVEELIMVTSIARQRVTIDHLQRELSKETARYERLVQPKLKHDSGVRKQMLKDRLSTNQNILRELLIEKGYLQGTDDIPF